MAALYQTDFHFDDHQVFYRGKVRDVYMLRDKFISIATDRISAFDHILPAPIPYKGQVLNQLAAFFLRKASSQVPIWLEEVPDPNVSIGKRCIPFKVEMVIRGYLAGHAWREYSSGKRRICGLAMPDGMKEGDAFPEPLITPATKAEEGHDEDISRDEIMKRGLVAEPHYLRMEKYTRALYDLGQKTARESGLILVDTKYEFGLIEDEVFLIDEVHTPDSSRYYYLDGYEERQKKGSKQVQLSKEFVREWLMENGFQGLEGQSMPVMTDEFIERVSKRYIGLYERLTGETFDMDPEQDVEERIRKNVSDYLSTA